MDRLIQIWGESLPQLLAATVGATIPLAIISFVIAMIIGVISALVRYEHIPVLSQLSALYIWIFRGTPLLVQLFIVFFGLPKVGIVFGAWPAAIIALSLNAGAYNSEAIRAALSSVPEGQWEAGCSLNLTHTQILRKIVAPQALRIALPPLSNNLIDQVKGTSLASTITIADLVMVSQQIAARTFEPLILYTEVALIYLVINTVLTFAQSWLEKRTSRFIEN
ncbi:MAG: amino acid ABC transporter permease [Actinomycetaceae bacterium]|nr:amino acid ABC transporter permease [Actinomycetaceae bacterium]